MKTRHVVLEERALADLELGHWFYETQEPGLGDFFTDTLLSDIASLQLYVGIHRKHCGYFALTSKRFPFAIFYVFGADKVYVQAVLDMRMSEEAIKERLGRRRQ